MFSNLLRQQARLALSARLATPFRQQSQRSLPALSMSSSQILSQRTFSISRSLFEEAPVTPTSQKVQVEDTTRSQTATVGTNEAEEHCRDILYVGNIPYSAEEGELHDLFSPYGQIRRVRIGADADGRQRGYAFIEFQTLQGAAAAVQSSLEEPFVLANRDLRIHFAKAPLRKNRDTHRKKRDANEPNKTIHISNYPRPGDDGPLREMLVQYEDKVRDIHFMKDHSGQVTQKVFVRFDDVDTATTVLEELHGKQLDGTTLRLFYAIERRKQSDSSGY